MNMDKKIDNKDNVNLLQHREEFERVYGIISAHKKRAMNAIHNESLNMLWEVGAYVSDRLKKAAWGDGVVRMLADPMNDFVSIELTQIPNVLFATGWSNHQLIMSRCKSDEQRLFYMLYAGREQLEYKELQRALKTDAMSSILGSKDVQSEMMKREYPQSGVLFKDTVYLEIHKNRHKNRQS